MLYPVPAVGCYDVTLVPGKLSILGSAINRAIIPDIVLKFKILVKLLMQLISQSIREVHSCL